MNHLTKLDVVIWSSFRVIPKITSANLWKLTYDIINYFIFICPFESGKWGKEGKKVQKIEYLKNKKNFSDEIKSIFHSLWRAVIWCKDSSDGEYWFFIDCICQYFYFCNIILIVGGLNVYFLRSISQQIVFVNFTKKIYFISCHLGKGLGWDLYKEWFWTSSPFLMLKTTFQKYWTSNQN